MRGHEDSNAYRCPFVHELAVPPVQLFLTRAATGWSGLRRGRRRRMWTNSPKPRPCSVPSTISTSVSTVRGLSKIGVNHVVVRTSTRPSASHVDQLTETETVLGAIDDLDQCVYSAWSQQDRREPCGGRDFDEAVGVACGPTHRNRDRARCHRRSRPVCLQCVVSARSA